MISFAIILSLTIPCNRSHNNKKHRCYRRHDMFQQSVCVMIVSIDGYKESFLGGRFMYTQIDILCNGLLIVILSVIKLYSWPKS
jgi:hypothetical protein